MSIKKFPCLTILATSLLAGMASSGFAVETHPIRLLLLTGGHPYDEPEFHAIWDNMEGVDVTHVELQDDSEIFENIAGWAYDTIVFYNMTSTISEHRLNNLFTLTEWGVGLIPLHHGTLSWPNQPRIREIFGVEFPNAGPFGFHLWQQFTYNIVDPDHPITEGMEDWDALDETYTNYYGRGYPGNRVLITTQHKPSDPELAWVRHLNNSRIAVVVGGHDRFMFENPNYQDLLYRSVLWTTGRLPEEIGGEVIAHSTIYREFYESDALTGSIARFDGGGSRAALIAVERRLAAGPAPEIVDSLVGLALNSTVHKAARTWSLHQIGLHGSATHLQAVAPLLIDAEYADAARYGFEISTDSASDAILLDAFAKATGSIRQGLAITMTQRGSAGLLESLDILVNSGDDDDFFVGVSSLGKVGGEKALTTLTGAASRVSESNLPILQEAMLSWAETETSDQAKSIYRELRSTGVTTEIRSAAWLAYLRGYTKDAADLAEALASPEARVRAAAIVAIPDFEGEALADSLGAAFEALTPREQIHLLYALERRADPTTLPIIHAAMAMEDLDVVRNAVYVAGTKGNSETAMLLIAMIADSTVERAEIVSFLAELSGDQIDTLLMMGLPQNDGATRVGIIEALTARLASSAQDLILEYTTDPDRAVRSAAYAALAELGNEAMFDKLITQFMSLNNTADMRLASRPLTDIRRRSANQDQQLERILSLLPSGSEEQVSLLIGVIAAGFSDASAVVLEQMATGDSENLRLAAIRALSTWPNMAPAETLFAIASADEGREAALAARGFLTVLSRDPAVRSDQRVREARRLSPHLRNPQVKTQYISVMTSTPSLESLGEVIRFIDDNDARREALQAIGQLAPVLSLAYPDAVLEALALLKEDPSLDEESRAEIQGQITFVGEFRERVVANWNFLEGLEGWVAENQSTLEAIGGHLVATGLGDDPYMSIEVEVAAQPMVLQFRVRYEESPGAFQFFMRTDEISMGQEGSFLTILPRPVFGEWVEYEVPFTPRGTIQEFRFDFAVRPVIVDIDYIRLMKP